MIETGMRRAAVTTINLDDIHYQNRSIRIVEKGQVEHHAHVSSEGLQAREDYIVNERVYDEKVMVSPALFLPVSPNSKDGRLTPQSINDIWNEVSEAAGVTGKTIHSAIALRFQTRHA